MFVFFETETRKVSYVKWNTLYLLYYDILYMYIIFDIYICILLFLRLSAVTILHQNHYNNNDDDDDDGDDDKPQK